MIDPTNTEPIPVHKPHIRRVLSLLAVFVLLVVALVFALREVNFSSVVSHTPEAESVPVIAPPTEGESIFTEDTQREFSAVEERVDRGEITREEGEILMDEIFKKVPPPEPPVVQ